MLVRNALARLPHGASLEIHTELADVTEDLRTWCRLTRNELVETKAENGQYTLLLRRGAGAGQTAQPDWGVRLPLRPSGLDARDWLMGRAGQVPEQAPASSGFTPRGAVAEPGMPDFPYRLNTKADVWVPSAAHLYEQTKGQQWNASTDIPWARLKPLPEDLERAVCQLMTFLAENEYSALYIPAKFIHRINAQFVETVLFLSTVINDEARHIEAFTKRALANGGGLQYSAAITEWSLHTLFLQDDYFRSGFLLHVLGEGTFLELLAFIERFAPDPVTAEVVRRTRADEGRHVAFGIAHVREHLQRYPQKADDLVEAAEQRSEALRASTGANPLVTEALAVLAGGGARPEQLVRGLAAVRDLYRDMDLQRVQRMLQSGLDETTARKVSELHTPNFM